MDNIESLLLNVSDLNSFYGSSHIIQGLSLHARKGEAIALLGRNGAGKTTLLMSLMGVVKTQVRDLSLEGQSIENASTVQRSRLGLILIPEDRRVFPDLTVEQNILLGAKAAKKVRSPIGIRKIYRCIPTLERLKDRYGSNLSGGEQQMVAIARGVMGAPRLLLLDEPLEGLAPLIAREIVAFLKILTVEAQFGFIIAEQSINLVRQCTNRVLVLSRGVIVFDGSWSDFDRNPTLINTHLAV